MWPSPQYLLCASKKLYSIQHVYTYSATCGRVPLCALPMKKEDHVLHSLSELAGTISLKILVLV